MPLSLTDYLQQVQEGTLDPNTFLESTLHQIKTAQDNAFIRLHDKHLSQQREKALQLPLQ